MVEGKSMPSTGHAPSWKSGAGNLPPAASTIESAPLCSKLSTGRTSAWWLSRGWTSPPLPDPSGSWAPVSSGTTTPNSTAATTASASPPPADRRGGAGSRLGGREHRWGERDSTREREQRFLKAQPPPLCTEATAKPRVLPLQNPRSASREPLLPLWGGGSGAWEHRTEESKRDPAAGAAPPGALRGDVHCCRLGERSLQVADPVE